ncbi:MAG: hypothetical protein ACR2RF_04475, partial [Geminicoccaceae bacterium]
MTEAGDELDSFSGLGEAVRPFDFGDDEQAVDWGPAASAERPRLDRPKEEEVFLAPQRDFSPSGLARDGDEVDAYIESPFAEPERKTASELMSPARRADGYAERSQQLFEANAPISDDEPALRMPAGGKEPTPDHAASKTPSAPSAPTLGPLSLDDDAFPMRRQLDAPRPKVDPEPVEPPPSSRLRLALGAIGSMGNICLRGALYFKSCLALQTRLMRLAWWALAQARTLVRHSGQASKRLGRVSVQACRIGGTSFRVAMKAVARHALALMKTSLSVVNRRFLNEAGATRYMQAWAGKVFGKPREMAENWLAVHTQESWLAERKQRHRAAAEAAGAAETAEELKAAEILKTQARAIQRSPDRPLPAPKALESSVTAKPVAPSPRVPSSIEKVAAKPASVNTALAQPRSRASFGLGSKGLAISGLAAASITFLLVGIALTPTTGPANATLTFAIPEKPILDTVSILDAVPSLDAVPILDTVPPLDTVSILDAVPPLDTVSILDAV